MHGRQFRMVLIPIARNHVRLIGMLRQETLALKIVRVDLMILGQVHRRPKVTIKIIKTTFLERQNGLVDCIR